MLGCMNSVALLAAVAGVAGQLAAPLAAGAGATCRSLGVDPVRTWQFARVADRWEVRHWAGEPRRNVVRLVLPASAAAAFSGQAVSVRAHTSNGGIDITLRGTAANAVLDVYVSYELEVNVDTSLSPGIDALNTEGPMSVRCEVPGTTEGAR